MTTTSNENKIAAIRTARTDVWHVDVTPVPGRPSKCLPDRDGALDFDGVKLAIYHHGDRGGCVEILADVTLVPGRDGKLEAYGDTIDHWLSGTGVQAVEAMRLARTARRDLAIAIVASCASGEPCTVEDLAVES